MQLTGVMAVDTQCTYWPLGSLATTLDHPWQHQQTAQNGHLEIPLHLLLSLFVCEKNLLSLLTCLSPTDTLIQSINAIAHFVKPCCAGFYNIFFFHKKVALHWTCKWTSLCQKYKTLWKTTKRIIQSNFAWMVSISQSFFSQQK